MGKSFDEDDEQGKLKYTFKELCELGDEDWASEAEDELECLNWHFDTETLSLWNNFYERMHTKYTHITNYLELTVLLAKVFIAYRSCYQDREKDEKDALLQVSKKAKALINKMQSVDRLKFKTESTFESLQQFLVDDDQSVVTENRKRKKLGKKRDDYMRASMYIPTSE